MPYLVGLAVLLAVVFFARRIGDTGKPPAPAEKKGTPASTSPLNAALLGAAIELIPDASTVLRPGAPILDAVYGGRKPDAFGGPAWGYYQTYLGLNEDGSKKSGGTTCSTILGYLMSKTGWPAEMIDRDPTDPVAPGGGFKPGASMTKIVFGAKKKGWYKTAPIELLPGDGYHVDHPPKPNSDHVGVILSVGERRPDGTREVVTIDGGQGTGADVKENTRILSEDGMMLTLAGVPARVLGVVRAGPEATA